MIPKIYSRKPWRRFPSGNDSVHTIRRICFAALVLEAAWFLKESKPARVSFKEEEQHRKVFIQENDKEQEDGILERYFGVRIRLREGVIEIYRREERQRTP